MLTNVVLYGGDKVRDADLERLRSPYATSEDPEIGFAKAMGVYVPEIIKLYDEVFDDLDEKRFGIGWWVGSLGATRRILAGHYLVECIKSVDTNLTEAALHLAEALDYWDKESAFLADCVQRDEKNKYVIKIPKRSAPIEDLTRRMATLHAIGFFRALVGSLDCLGASIVGVMGLPTELRRASMKSSMASLKKCSLEIQSQFRVKLEALIAGTGPPGWLQWIEDYRNMTVHRGRRWHINQVLPRPGGLLGPDGKWIPRSISVEQLPADPGLSQIEALVGTSQTYVLTEHGATTMEGALKSSIRLVQGVAVELLNVWRQRRESPRMIAQPNENWPDGLNRISTGFVGYSPGSLPFDPKIIIPHGDMARQFKTAAVSDELRHLWPSFD